MERRLKELTASNAEKIKNAELLCKEEYERELTKHKLELNAKLEVVDTRIHTAVLEEQTRIKDEMFAKEQTIASLQNLIESEK